MSTASFAPATSAALRQIDDLKHQPEPDLVARLVEAAALDAEARAGITKAGADLVRRIRADARPGLMEVFLAEYGLSTDEGVALMCLAEALLRVPDAETIDDLIEDKIAPSDWGKHIGKSASPLVNASTWGLFLTGKVLDERPGMATRLRGAVKRLGEPVIRAAVGRAMREMGRQFVLGESIGAAMKRASGMEAKGYTYSYDMLGEAAMTRADAEGYAKAYGDAIAAIAKNCKGAMAENPGISVKLSALHPRYEVAKQDRVMAELVPVVTRLARQAAEAGMNFAVDAEEADRLVLSLKVIEAVLADEALEGWDGFGVVVQAYGRRCGAVLDWLHGLADRLGRRITVRLVKGAYWDSEIKHAQVEGLEDFPVFSRKPATDISYIACARKLLGMTDRIYPQFATHNAHTVAAVLHMAEGLPRSAFEFQRLHGMGERLHDLVLADNGTHCRIYAPVGTHKDLLAYLVRRLLENGANSSFVNQIVDESVPPEEVAACPFAAWDGAPAGIPTGPEVFPGRKNSRGFDLSDVGTLEEVGAAIAGARPVAAVADASAEEVETALGIARAWDVPVAERAEVLRRAAELYERDWGALFAVLIDEAGKTLADAVGELREAVDFLRYYAGQAEASEASEGEARGVFVCISPWNFPLAIFSGQVAAALATGNGVLAKPAEQTPRIAAAAVALLHEAGVPRDVLQLVPGDGAVVGAALTGDARVSGVAFTGSTATAKAIARAMAKGMAPGTPLIAETGGLNAMIVDSTALPQQATRDVVASAFQSAGQRCSALRCLYVQEDVAESFIEMLTGAMDELAVADPALLSTDVGPVIDAEAAGEIAAYVEAAKADGRLVKQLDAPEGNFIGPALIEVGGIADLGGREVFGPVLHVARFKAGKIRQVVADVNATGFGLTFGLHTRIDTRVQEVSDAVEAGNVYVNRNQIGAIVGSQPFGGEGLSGTGPKAGGPHYLQRFRKGGAIARTEEAYEMPGPTGEANRLRLVPRGGVLCCGPDTKAQVAAVEALGGRAVAATVEEALARDALSTMLFWGEEAEAREIAVKLAERDGPVVALVRGTPDVGHVMHERHLCVDTTAAGGNAALLAAVSE
ncbi:L-glutamate gamma-semialdehyde dehydrogenase [Vannielia litorea]|uniref:L-glutamate gamma-semialdehyde dehydrogenase n=1 Tax=Vannielia litorea TaxID=1217970 RepID=UPI001BCD7592|nr:L-glutamate gamma-semialdehyde dehydrogenase [Vannielia litorea]MBS8228242.1 L-glutamate gamma-semialdehyde dehydrogenase [Vannielia litorea]